MKRWNSTLALLIILVCSLMGQDPMLTRDINGNGDASPTTFYPYNGKLLFRATNDTVGVELWISDGTPEGTMLVKDINENPGLSSGNSNPDNYITYNGKVYFKAKAQDLGDELWVTDGTTGGTVLVKDIQEGPGNANPFDMVVFKDKFYFTANNGNSANSSELWVSDGTADGTMMLIDINPGGAPGNPINKTVVGDLMYFAANDGTNGVELWVSDGTAEGTRMVKDIRTTGNSNSSPSQFFAFNGEVYFRANDGINGVELWKTDGTEEGTVLVKDINSGSGSSSPTNFFVLSGQLFFSADDGINGRELWTTNGTPESTYLFQDINMGGSSSPENFVEVLPGIAFFTANNGVTGTEPWFLLATQGFVIALPADDINPGAGSSNPMDPVFTGYALYFSAETPDHGRELYRLSVFDELPVRISDINPGSESAEIDDITQVGSQIFFEATDGATGLELWKLDIPLSGISLTTELGTIAPGDTLELGGVVANGTTSISREVALTSTGTAALSILEDNFAQIFPPFNVTIDPEDTDSIPPGASHLITVTFTPTQSGEFFEEVQILSSAADPALRNFRFVIHGTGVAPFAQAGVLENGQALSSGVAVGFNTVLIGEDSLRQFTIRNDGNVDLEILFTNLSDEDNFFLTDINSPLAPGAQDTFLIGFRPQMEGPLDAQLTIGTNGVNNAFIFNLSGTGKVAAPTIVVTDEAGTALALEAPVPISFGEVLEGQDSSIMLIIENPGDAELVLSDLTLNGDAFSSSALPAPIAPGTASSLTITFAPTGAGLFEGSLSFATNDPGQAGVTLALSGTGLMDTRVRELAASEMGIFPNPVRGQLILRLEQPLPNAEIRLFDGQGKLLRRLDAGTVDNGFRLNLDGLPTGNYLLELRNNEVRGVAKFVKL